VCRCYSCSTGLLLNTWQVAAGKRSSVEHLELHHTSGLGVRPARVSAMLWETTLSQYSSVRGTTSQGTPASLHTWEA
jgi:hypothetical protein